MRASQTAPGITPALVERLVASRQDLTKADIKEVRRLLIAVRPVVSANASICV
jgi:hypothetical protein